MRRNKPAGRFYSDAGFSLIELSIVVLVIAVISGIALLDITGIMPRMSATAAMYQTVAQLRAGREMAIAQRRDIQLRFIGGNQIQLVRVEVPNGTTVLSTITMEDKIGFRLFDGLPDSPDSFGNGAPVQFGNSDALLFLSDGTLVDAEGNPLNGTVFLGQADRPETARAITVVGATGRVRGYRWTGESWIQ